MSDQIKISGIKGFGFHGVLESERKTGQHFLIDAVITLNLQNLKDDLSKTINYSEIADAIKNNIESNPVNLIETLAERIATDILSKYVQAQAVEISVHKPGAPLNVEFSDLSVTIKKSK